MQTFLPFQLPSPVVPFPLPEAQAAGVELWLKRDDLIHPFVSGNKWRKLKGFMAQAQQTGATTLVTFGGAYSNHLAAVAALGQLQGYRTIGFIRGELPATLSSTLRFVQQCGMELRFMDRAAYRAHTDPTFLADLSSQYAPCVVITAGGFGIPGLGGCTEIVQEIPFGFDVICCACGTGTTLAGLAAALAPHQTALGFPALKNGGFLKEEINQLLHCAALSANGKTVLETRFHFGGYARYNAELTDFIRQVYRQTGIPLDVVYTGKMVYGLAALLREGWFTRGQVVVAVHTGGLQGNPEGLFAGLTVG